VHLDKYPVADEPCINEQLETRMGLAQKICSLVLSIRKKENLKVRQPLNKILIPILNPQQQEDIATVESLILNEVNVKEIEFLGADNDVITKTIKPNFQKLGKKLGAKMKSVQQALQSFSADDIKTIESSGKYALDVTLTDNLIEEGLAREFVNKVQRLRKDQDFEVTDQIKLQVLDNPPVTAKVTKALERFKDYICSETLSVDFQISENLSGNSIELDINDNLIHVSVSRLN